MITQLTTLSLSLLLLGSLGTGCSNIPLLSRSTLLEININVSDQVNPDNNGRASPVVLRIYELKTLSTFEAADYFSLFNDDAAVLAADLVQREEYYLRPGDERQISRKPPEESKFLAVMAAYRDLNQAIWKSSIPIRPKKKTKLKIVLEPLTVSINPNKNRRNMK